MIEPFKQAMQNAGLEPPAEIFADGMLHRFTVSGDKSRSDNGWYVLHADDPAAGQFGCWKRGLSKTWSSKAYQSFTPEQKTSYTAKMEAMKQQRDEGRERIQAECRKWCTETWANAKDATNANPYLKHKGVHSYGLRTLKDSLIMPLRDITGAIHGMQFIYPDGSKKYKSGTDKTGHFYKIGKFKDKTVLICEGYATGASLHQVTGHCVVVAFDAGNLLSVAQVIREKCPDYKIIICADVDHATEGNPGLTNATEAARAVNGLLAIPAFPDTKGPKDTDFNDMARLLSPEAVKVCIEAAAMPTASPVTECPSQAGIEIQEPELWPEPILFGEIQTPNIPCSILPGWLGDYAAAVAATTQTPQGMSVMMALAVVAACVQKRFQVARTPEHIEPLAIWTATGLPPANRKTAVINAFTGPLTAWEQERSESEKRERGRIAGIREAMEIKIKAIQAQAGKADDNAERNRLIEDACRLREEMPEPLSPPRIFSGDVTPERLQGLMMEHGERMAVISDEGGIFAVMAGLYSGGKANIDIFLKGHAGSAVRVDRQDRTAHLDEPALTFGLCIQPDIIRRLSETSFRGNGCLARFLFCLPVSNIGTRTAHTIPMPESVKAAYRAGINTLLNIPLVQNEFGQERARTITLDHGAAQAWEAFFNFMESNMGEGKELEPIQDWAGKLAGAALRVAGIMAVVEQGEATKEISEGTMTKALDFAELLISHAQTAFDLIDGDDALHDAKHVYRWIMGKGTKTFKRRDAQQELTRFREVERLEKALSILAKRYIVSEPEKVKSESGRGMPSIVYHVNPAIFDRQP